MIRNNIKKGTALLLTASMLMGLSLSAVDSIDAHAEPDTTIFSAYASKAELQDSFAPNEDGTATTIGKLIFGKNEDGNDQEWYILGKDSGVDGENTAIFAASNMIYYHDGTKLSVMFEDNYSIDKTYTSDMGTYTSGSPTNNLVSPNHYGASDIRQVLLQIAGEKDIDEDVTNISKDRYSSLFSEAELGLLQATTVRTDDFRGDSQVSYLEAPNYYTTSDKLYLGAWDYDGKKANYPWASGQDRTKFYVGSEDSKKVLNMDTYWSEPSSGNYYWFWLRSPYSIDYDLSLIANPGSGVRSYCVDDDYIGVRPASNLNLSSVLFASSTTADGSSESGVVKDITSGTAMTLRMKGDGDDAKEQLGGTVGGVKLVGSEVQVTKGDTTKPVTLIIQGKDSNGDWYYAKTITENTTVKASDITDHEDADLSKCYIWLEATGKDGMIYAVDSEMTPAHTHTYDDTWTDFDVEKHGHRCTDPTCPNPDDESSFSNLEEHSWGDDNICDICGYKQGDHSVYKVEKKPTSTRPGSKPHLECRHCDKWFEYPAINGILVEITDKSAYIIPATGGGSSSGGSSSSVSTGWIKDSKGWKYRNSDGILAKGTTVTDADGNKVEKILWQKAGNGYYAFGSDGYLVTGWIYDKLEDKWYYCDENSGKLYGWFYSTEDSYWYYLSPSTGEALTGWHSINGKDYYFASAPAAPTYSFDATTDTWIYSNINGNRPFGSMYANTVTPDNYTVDASGAWVR